MAFNLFEESPEQQQAAAAKPAFDPSQMRPTGATAGADDEAVEESEQNDYDRFVSSGIKLINGPACKQLINAMNDKNKSVPAAAGGVLAQVVETLKSMFDNTDKPVSEDVVMHGSEELAEELINVGNEARIWTVGDDQIEDTVQRTMMEAAKLIGDDVIAKGNPLKEDAKRFMSDQIEKEVSRGEVSPEMKQNLITQSIRGSMAGV